MATMNQADIDYLKGQGPSHIEQAGADTFVLDSEIIKDHPRLLNQYFQSYGRKMTTLRKFGLIFPGRLNTSPSESPFTSHYEKAAQRDLVTVDSIVAGSDAGTAVITLSPDDVVSIDNGYGLTYTQSRPRVKDTLQATAMGVLFRIIAKSADQSEITVQSFDGSDPLDEIEAGQVLTIGAPIQGEGMDQNRPLRPRRVKYTNTFWITPETDVVSGSHLTTRVSFDVVPGSGLLFLEGLGDMVTRAEYNKGNIWLFGQQAAQGSMIDYSELLGENVGVPGTQGLLDYARQMGGEVLIDPNDFGLDDMYALAAEYHDQVIGTSEILLGQGYRINAALERNLSSLLNYNWVIGVSDRYIAESAKSNWGDPLNEDSMRGAWLSLGFTGFSLGQFTFLQTAIPEFNDSRGPGAIGYADFMISMPFGKTEVYDQAGGSNLIPYFGYEYRGTAGYARENELWMKAGAGSAAIINSKTRFNGLTKTDEWDGVSFYERTEMAPHFARGDAFRIFRPTGASS